MARLKQSTAYTRMFYMVQSADHTSALTGASPAVSLSKAGGTFASAGGTVTEVANGWYKIALTTTDTNTLGELAYHITATSGDPTDFVDQISSIPLQKNTALAGFTFTMTDSTSHNPSTGLTVTATRSLDGAAFAGCANSVVEISGGDYKLDLAATDLNANVVMLRMTATGADDLNIMLVTQ